MELQLLITIIALSIIAIISLIFGILFLIKYAKKRKIIYLIVGILLTFIIPAIVIYFLFRFYIGNPLLIAYGPNPGMVYGPGPVIAYGPAAP